MCDELEETKLEETKLEEDMILARRVAAAAIRRYPNSTYIEDIYATAYLGMVEARLTAPEGELRNPYLVRTISNHICSLIEGISMIRVPSRSKKRIVARGVALPIVDPLEAVEDVPDKEHGLTLEELPLDEGEAKIIDMLISGYSQTEVIASLGMSKGSFYRKLDLIKTKTIEYLY